MKKLHEPVYAARIAELVRRIGPHLRAGDCVLDIGCGFGALGRALLDAPGSPGGLDVRGLESHPRQRALIEIDAYDGKRVPHDDGAFDVVILADVLHHEPDPHALLAEAVRVAKRNLIVKDHKRDGLLAQNRIALLDWAANRPYGVECLYRYNTLAEWHGWFERHGLEIVEELRSMRLYPRPYNLVLGGKLHYLAVLGR